LFGERRADFHEPQERPPVPVTFIIMGVAFSALASTHISMAARSTPTNQMEYLIGRFWTWNGNQPVSHR